MTSFFIGESGPAARRVRDLLSYRARIEFPRHRGSHKSSSRGQLVDVVRSGDHPNPIGLAEKTSGDFKRLRLATRSSKPHSTEAIAQEPDASQPDAKSKCSTSPTRSTKRSKS